MTHRPRLRAALATVAALVAGATLTTTAVPSDAAPRRLPDTAVTAVTAPARATIGKTIAASARVANRGRAAARPAAVRFLLSRDARPGVDVGLSPRTRAQGLPPGRAVTVRARVTVPTSVKPGTYYLLACATPGGRDAARGNNCRAGRRIAVVEAPWEGRLSGTLTFTRATDRVDGSEEVHTSDRLQLGFDIEVDENLDGWAAFTSIQSAYTYDGARTRVHSLPWCRTDEQGTSHGGGPIVQNWHPYYDVFYGDFVRTDHSQIRLLTQLPYTTTDTVTTTPLEENGCDAATTVDSYDARTIDSLILQQIKRSPDEVVYRVLKAEHAESRPTTWQHITGTLVFTHAD